MSRVSTNIEIEDVRVRATGQPMTREEALGMRGVQAMDEPAADVTPRGAT